MASQGIFSAHAGSSSAKFLIVLLYVSAMEVGCSEQALPFGQTSASMNLQSLIKETGEATRQYVESIVGTNVVETGLEVRTEKTTGYQQL